MTNNKVSVSKTAKAVGSQVERLINDIDSELKQFETSIGNRLHLIQANKDGQLTTAQLQLVLKSIRTMSKDSTAIEEVIKRLDKDGDGKVFLSDILKLSKEANGKEGQGILIEDKTINNKKI